MIKILPGIGLIKFQVIGSELLEEPAICKNPESAARLLRNA